MRATDHRERDPIGTDNNTNFGYVAIKLEGDDHSTVFVNRAAYRDLPAVSDRTHDGDHEQCVAVYDETRAKRWVHNPDDPYERTHVHPLGSSATDDEPRLCTAKNCGRPLSEHTYGIFCP